MVVKINLPQTFGHRHIQTKGAVRERHPLWYSGLGKPMDRGTRQAIVHGVAKIQI